jgi:hypothetical protein
VHAHVQRMVSVVKLATVLEVVLPKSSILLCVFCGQTRLNAKNINNKMFPVHGVKCLSCEAVQNWVANISLTKKRLKWRCGCG